MRWVYLSPHFDDVVLSCGGLVWEQVQAGQHVAVWTVCAGGPALDAPLSPFAQMLHDRWGTGPEAVQARREEDEAAMARLGVPARYWDLPDCIYRRLAGQTMGEAGPWLVNGEDDLWQPVHPGEAPRLDALCAWLLDGLRPDDRIISPLTLGNHVDHNLTRAAAQCAAQRAGLQLWYYQDYPYVIRPTVNWTEKTGENWEKVCYAVSRAGLNAWQDAVACYISQASTFWSSRGEMESAFEAYWQTEGGACLWKAG